MRVVKLSYVVAALVLTAGAASAAGAEADTPTFTKDVAPILYENCVTCHRAGEAAPMSLITYQETRPWGRSIKNKVLAGEMPPWHAAPSVGRFLNDRRMTDAERDTIVRWVDAGAPEGDRAKLPPAPTFADGWQIGNPDVIIEIPEAFEVPAEGEIRYQMFVAPTNFTEDRWIRAMEVRAGVPAVVHHILVFARVPGAAPQEQAFKFVPLSPQAVAAETRRAERALERGRPLRALAGGPGPLVGMTAPGTNPMVLESDTAMRIPAGTQFVFSIHYTPSGEAASDKSRLGIIFADGPPREEVVAGQIMNPYFEIPAGAANLQVDTQIEFTKDVEIDGLIPHTHLRGKAWDYHLVYPDGRREHVLSVPAYDFNWQTLYAFETPLSAPKGARLEASAWYDNSVANKANPDPTVAVRWGEQTFEEMQYTAITYRVVAPEGSEE